MYLHFYFLYLPFQKYHYYNFLNSTLCLLYIIVWFNCLRFLLLFLVHSLFIFYQFLIVLFRFLSLFTMMILFCIISDSTGRKRGPFVSSGGGDRNYAVERIETKSRAVRVTSVDLQDIFIRDCPITSIEHPMLHTTDIGDHMFQGGMSGYVMP
ncbi:hypothetical protein HanXRQr2_Chr11g0486321 [Helianthus annuus]|uniref:Uncharacterized protein n=1 Tax=Helianthus annuus TaxID=4232 RepID=A0A251TBP2_HELAN|nr:hypothetical protein HanXRQr2_Chr11g0486321 [Helianthus annuus]KAJ0874790.1 hypothetical protein HanPSC8_Chr11g0468441 [Helianthus annuus]